MSQLVLEAEQILWPSLEEAKLAASACRQCGLCETRRNVVFSAGNRQAKLMIIGEGPGQREDETGLPFVGAAGQLLDKILAAVELTREKDVYICNIVKCRPPQNRVPTPVEIEACRPFLLTQIKFVQPKIILLAGATAMQAVLQIKEPISKVRGKWFDYENGAKVMPIFHPSYLLHNEERKVGSPKWFMWQDIKAVRAALNQLSQLS